MTLAARLLATLAFTLLAAPVHAETITVAAVGDLMMGSDFPDSRLPPADGEGIFDAVKAHFQNADIVFGNLEGALADSGETKKCSPQSTQCFAFRTPTRFIRHLKDAGFTVLSIANNHANDFGEAGVNSTLATLAAAGIQPAGGEKVATLEVKGRRIAVLGFSYLLPSPISHSILDLARAQDIVRAAKREHDLVIVSFHAGAEGKGATLLPDADEIFLGENRGNSIRFAHAVVDAGADLVLGHGPHVLRPTEIYKGRFIAYSLGNFLTYGRFNLSGPSGLSGVLSVSLDAETGTFRDTRLHPVRLVRGGIPEPDAEGEAAKLLDSLTRAHNRDALWVEANGRVMPN